MRPENRRIKSKRAAVSRGRMYLKANLNWLHGFPVSFGNGYIQWISIPMAGEVSADQIKLTGEHFHNATYTYNKLIHNFPKALSGIVENKDSWCERVPKLLNILKDSVHENKKYPDSTTSIKNCFPYKTLKLRDELCADYKELTPIIDVFSWLTFIYPEDFLHALTWLRENYKAVMQISKNENSGIISIILLFRIEQSEGKKRCEKLIGFFSDENIFKIITGDSHYFERVLSSLNRLRKAKKLNEIPQTPEADFGKYLIVLTSFIYKMNNPARKKALKLLSIMLPEDFVSNWGEFWQKAFPLTEKSKRIPLGSDLVTIKNNAEDTYNELQELIKSKPKELYPSQFFKRIRKMSDQKNTFLYRKSLPILSKLPLIKENQTLRPAFLDLCLFLTEYSNGPQLLTPFRQYLSKNSKIINKLRLGEDNSYKSLFREILYEEEDQKLWPVIFDTMAQVLEYKNNYDFDDSDLIVSLVQVTRSSSLSVSYAKQLIDIGKHRVYFSSEQLRCIYLTDKGNNKVGLIAEKMIKLEDDDDIDYKSLLKIIRKLKNTGWENLVLEEIEDGKLKVLNTLGKHVSLLEKLNIETNPVKCPEENFLPLNTEDLPDNLSNTISEPISILTCISGDGGKRAKKIIAEFIPSKKKIKSEITSLKEKLEKDPENSSLSIRVTNLENSLKAETTITENMIIKLQAKLKRAIRTTVISDWLNVITSELASNYGKYFEISEDSEFFINNTELLGGILNLPKSFRDTGIELIKKSLNGCTKSTFDLEENIRFIESLKNKGIKTEYWTESQPSFEIERKSGGPLTVSIEDNLIEIMKMGHYFKTCLSPGSFNFFSAVVNTVDINKRVVFARDKNNKVIGRCLFALTIDGAILTYNPYCHDKGFNFSEIMGDFAARLASKMNTIVANHGDVPTLVLNDWYDDGAMQICQKFAFLDHGSDFRTSLKRIDKDKFLSELERLFSPLKLNELTLPPVIEFRELLLRPDLILPLLPIIKSCENLSEQTKIKSAKLAYLAGERSYSVHILSKRAEKYLIHHDYHYNQDYGLIEILSEINPSAALRVIRKTRNIKKDEYETAPERIRLLTLIHSRLGRNFKIKAISK